MVATARIVFAERRALDRLPQENHFVYIVDYPICQVDRAGQLLVAKNYTSWGEIKQITIDAHQRFVIKSTSGHSLTLGAKKIVNYDTDAEAMSVAALLKTNGYSLPVTAAQPITDEFKVKLAAVFPTVEALTEIPEKYAVIDCEFGVLFGTQHQGDSIVQRRATVYGEKAGIFQLAVLGYTGNRALDLFFNHYLDNPNFSAEVKLRGLKETKLTLAEYDKQTDPVTVLKAFVHEVLARRLPLVFWDKSNDLRLLRHTLAVNFDAFSAAEQALLGTKLAVFDGSIYTNQVINRSNHRKKDTHHYLPLNGVAGLLNIFNPHQHNALWDAQTTHAVVNALAKIQQTEPMVLTRPQAGVRLEPVIESTGGLSQQKIQQHVSAQPQVLVPTPAVFCQLRTNGKTYREIAKLFGISTSTVWRAVKQHTKSAITN